MEDERIEPLVHSKPSVLHARAQMSKIWILASFVRPKRALYSTRAEGSGFGLRDHDFWFKAYTASVPQSRSSVSVERMLGA